MVIKRMSIGARWISFDDDDDDDDDGDDDYDDDESDYMTKLNRV